MYKINHLNSGTVPVENNISICTIFKWLGCLVFKWHSKTRPFSSFYHLNTEQVWYSDPHWLLLRSTPVSYFEKTNRYLDSPLSPGYILIIRSGSWIASITLCVILTDPDKAAMWRALLRVPEWSTDGVSHGLIRYLWKRYRLIRYLWKRYSNHLKAIYGILGFKWCCARYWNGATDLNEKPS